MKPRVPNDPNMTKEVRAFLESLARQTQSVSGVVVTAANQDYRIIERIPYPATITSFTAKMTSGTLTATLKINTTAITGGTINVTSTQQTVTPTDANSMRTNDALVMTVSAISSPVDFSYTVAYSRTLA